MTEEPQDRRGAGQKAEMVACPRCRQLFWPEPRSARAEPDLEVIYHQCPACGLQTPLAVLDRRARDLRSELDALERKVHERLERGMDVRLFLEDLRRARRQFGRHLDRLRQQYLEGGRRVVPGGQPRPEPRAGEQQTRRLWLPGDRRPT